MEKVIRDNKVAVLYSPGYGAGWYSWNDNNEECLFHPEIVQLVEENRHTEITKELCAKLFGDDFYCGGADQLEIMWLDKNALFQVGEYDGSESICLQALQTYLIA